MSSTLVSVTFDAIDPARLGAFWGALLGRSAVLETTAGLVPGESGQMGLRFVPATTQKSGLNRLHLHLTSDSLDRQQETVMRALDLGAQHLDVGQLPEEEHVVLADPEGNEFCVIEPGNNFLADCGLLGEVTCEGSRDAGLFWHEALGWTLVWDENEETAIQSPVGGTKISWGGPPLPPKQAPNRQRFDLAAADPAGEAARLGALGATRLGEHDGGIELADPDGNEFWIRQP